MIERNDELVTVFGGGGFIGHYVCEFLLRSGVRIRIAQRNPGQAYTIQPLAQVGQFGFVAADIRDPTAVWRAVKGEGEEAVRKAFPGASIVRPSLAFGPEDNLTNRFAGMANLPFLPVIAGKRNFQPVYVRDLGKAIALAALDPQRFGGKIYEIGGPQVMSMIELHRAILGITGQDTDILPLPDLAGKLLSSFGWLPGAPLTRDQWLMLQRDNVPSGEYPGLEALGIKPTPLGAVGGEWLGRFQGDRFAGRRINLTAAS